MLPDLSSKGQYLHLVLLQIFFILLLNVSVDRDGVGRGVAPVLLKSPVDDVEVMLRSPGVPRFGRDRNSFILVCLRVLGDLVRVGDLRISHWLVGCAVGVFIVTSARTRMSLRFLGRL